MRSENETRFLFKEKAKENQIRKPQSVKQISAEQKTIETRKELAKVANDAFFLLMQMQIIVATRYISIN